MGMARVATASTPSNTAGRATSGVSTAAAGGFSSRALQSRPPAAAAPAAASSSPSSSSSLSLKRPSLSPSPATGLMGLVENRYLTCFIQDFAAFYRVLDEVTVRQGIINIMQGGVDSRLFCGATPEVLPPASPPPAKRSARGVGTGRGGRPSPLSSSSRAASSAGRAEPTAQEPGAAAPCRDVYSINSALFSSMALGALLLGQPPSYSQQYIAVAESSLRLCGTEIAPVSNERVAIAHLLLAFATNMAGKSEYGLHIQLTRQCYDERMRRGLPTPPPILEILGYRKIIDALGAPTGKNRVPAPKESNATSSRGSGKIAAAAARAAPASAATAPAPAVSLPKRTENGTPASGDGTPTVPPVTWAGGSREGDLGACVDQAEATAPAAAAAAVAGGRENVARERPRKWHGRRAERAPAGLEAARERRRWKKADPLLMVCDIMTMLSKCPWSTKVDGGPRQARGQLKELRSLVVAEKALADERRLAARMNVRILA